MVVLPRVDLDHLKSLGIGRIVERVGVTTIRETVTLPIPREEDTAKQRG